MVINTQRIKNIEDIENKEGRPDGSDYNFDIEKSFIHGYLNIIRDMGINGFIFEKVGFESSHHIEFNNCVFYCCNFSDINECSFRNCLFINGFYLENIKRVSLNKCCLYIKGNEPQNIFQTEYVKFTDCIFKGNKKESFTINNIREGEFINCNFYSLDVMLSISSSNIIFDNSTSFDCRLGFLLSDKSNLEIYNSKLKSMDNIIERTSDSNFISEGTPSLTIEKI